MRAPTLVKGNGYAPYRSGTRPNTAGFLQETGVNRNVSKAIMLTIVALLATASATAPAPTFRPTVACPAVGVQPSSEPTTIPIEVWSNHIYVKVCLSGRELEFILDTGAGVTSLDLNTAKQLGVGLGQTFTVGGAGPGRVAGARVDVATVTLAGTSIAQNVATAIDLSSIPSREAHRMDGILGDDFIGRHVLALDYARSELRIYDRDAFSYGGSGVSVPVTLVNLFPHIDAELRLPDGTTLRAHCVVDVGSGGTLALTKPFVDDNKLRARIGPTIRRTGGGGVGGSAASDIGRVASMSIGGVELARPIVMLFGDSAGTLSRSASWEGNIGGAILRRFTVFLDYQRKRMIFEPNATKNDAFETDMSGLGLGMNDSLTTIVVMTVAPNTPGAEAGVAPGDVIVSVDGRPGTQRVLGDLRDRLRRPDERATLIIRRGGENKRVEIVTRRAI
jgi:hypothetical protein